MRRVVVLAALLFTLLAVWPHAALADGGIEVVSSRAEARFPTAVTFYLEAEAPADIVDIDIVYRVSASTLVPVSCRAPVDFEAGRSVAASWQWDMLQSGGLPPGTEVEYRWVIQDAAGQRLESASSAVCFDDRRYDWDSIAGDGLVLYWYDGDEAFAAELLSAAEEARQSLSAQVGVPLERPATYYIYASAADLQGALIYPAEWTGGMAFPAYDTVVIGISPGNLDWGQRAVAHEMGHLVVHQAMAGPYGRLPTWLDEGLAMHAEGRLRSDLQGLLQKAIAGDSLFSVRSISSSFPAAASDARLSYAESYSLVSFLIDGYGSDKILELLEAFKAGSTDDGALLQVYGYDTDSIDGQWRQSLGLSPEHPPTPAGVARSLDTPYVVLFIMVGILALLCLYLGLLLMRRMG